MMKTASLVSCLWAAQSARVTIDAQLAAEESEDLSAGVMAMMQSVGVANGFLNMTSAASAGINKLCDPLWPKSLDKEFRDKFVVGSGATACVYLAYDETDTLVAVKVGKSSGRKREADFAAWKAECDDMQSMRMKGCRAGKELLDLHEQYLPTCTKVGMHEQGAYYVMHAAGTKGIAGWGDMGFTTAQSKVVFAEFVTSVYALHAVDLTHNDLHGQNIVLDILDVPPPRLALIDFGSLKTLERSWKKDYKRDGSAIWRWAAVLAGCPRDAQWPNPPTTAAATQFLGCMSTYSEDEPEFMAAMQKLVFGAVKETKDHGVVAVYKSKFIQDYISAPKKLYPWEGTGDCLSWDNEKWAQFVFDEKFPGFVKCDTIKTHKWTKTTTKRGKTRSRVVEQCPAAIGSIKTACYSLTPLAIWSCGGCSTEKGAVNQGMDGGCFFDSDPRYKYAATWSM